MAIHELLMKLGISSNFFSNLPAPTPNFIFNAVIIFAWLVFIWETYLSYRQHVTCSNTPALPMELSGVMDQATYTKARNYHVDKTRFNFLYSVWSHGFQMVVLYFGFIPFMWSFSAFITAKCGYGKEHEITQTTVFYLAGSLFNFVIEFPWSVYLNFVIEERYGFNKETPGFFVKDKIKKFIVTQALVLPIIATIVYIVKIGGDLFFIYLWLFSVFTLFALMTIYPDYIAPLFDKFTNLPDGELRKEIEKLASSIKFPLKKIYVVDGSKRSAHSNAYLYGFFKNKRIVLFDTLLKDHTPLNKEVEDENEDADKKEKGKLGCSDNEVVAIIAHELGHWKLNHVAKNLILAQANMFFSFAVFAYLFKFKNLYAAFGFYDEQPIMIGILIIFLYIFSPYNEILSIMLTILSRRFEFEADGFAKKLNRSANLRSALVKLNKDNLSFPVYDWLYSAWHHSHPSLLERLQYLGKLD